MLSAPATAKVPPRRAVLACALTLAAGLIHSAAAVPHFGDDTLLGTGFMVTGWAQIVIAALLLRRTPSRPVAVSGVVVHTAALGALVVSRTIGLPVGHGGAEPMAFPDGVTAGLELASLAVLAWWLARPTIENRHSVGSFAAVTGAWVIALGGSTAAVANLGTAGHGHGGEPAMDAHEEQADGHAHGDSAADDHASDGAGTAAHGRVDGMGMDADDGASSLLAAVHEHGDRSLHIHQPASAHVHDDGTVDVHLVHGADAKHEAPAGAGDADTETSPAADDGHTHAPGEGHG
jgi:hypothetical protein